MRCKIIWSLWASPCQLSKSSSRSPPPPHPFFLAWHAHLCVFHNKSFLLPSCRRCRLISGKSLSRHLCCTESTRRLSLSLFFLPVCLLISQPGGVPFVPRRVHRQKSLCVQFSACDWRSWGGQLKVCDKDVLWELEKKKNYHASG